MKDKIDLKNIIHWLAGIVACSFGVCMCTKAGFGLSMIAAPPYILHVFMSRFFSWYTQGRSEYIWELFLLIVMCIAIQRFRLKFLFSFGTAVLVGLLIDGFFSILGGNGSYSTLAGRIVAFIVGTLITCCAIAFIFRTTLPGQVYEMFVINVSERYGFDRDKVKLVHDICMLVISLVLAFALTGGFTGIGIGTVVTAFINSPLIKFFGMIIDKAENSLQKPK
ncbi:MAG: hypothetical protein J6U10_02925 [Lachnospiraceae bacterium]|nr:hypothetical protein [Lachnospiraceae bacterium]